MAGETLIKIRKERLKKIQELRKLGINPYPAKSYKNINNQDIIDNYKKFENKEVCVAGRLVSWREHGKLFFGHIQDESGKIQLYIKEGELANTSSEKQIIGIKHLNFIDKGDFLEAKGIVTKTIRGEVSILVKELKIISKSIRPLPDNWLGLKDKEERIRRRYLDFTMKPKLKELFFRKSKFWDITKNFLKNRGFIEIETPVLEHVTGGADAKPFITHHNDLDQDFYLRISTELFQKRLIGAGFEKIFTFGPNFRNEGISDEHLQEYYAIEWYVAYANYLDNMQLVKDLFRYVASTLYKKTKFTSRGHTFDLANDWIEIDYKTILKEKTGIDIFVDDENKMLKILEDNGVKLEGEVNKNRLVDNLWKLIRKTISGPAFLINIPKFISPLAKSTPGNENITERFQVIIAGSELGNGYSEINDPVDQLNRFLDQEKLRKEGDEEAQMLDIDYIEMLEYGMPPVSGWGHSERLFWFFENVTGREGTLFPMLKFELDENTKKIYGNILRDVTRSENKKEKIIKLKKYLDKQNNKPKKFPSHEEIINILKKYVSDPYQRLHARMVEAAMIAYAEKYGENPTLWSAAGLLHDIDFDKWPEIHPNEAKIREITENKFPDEVYEAIMGHNTKAGFPRKTKMAQALLATDEVTGLFYATAKMRPEGFDMKVKSIKKKFNDKSFAERIDRNEIITGLNELGITLDEHLEFLIDVFKTFQNEL